MNRQTHKEALGVAHSLTVLRLNELLPDSKVAVVTIAEIDDDGVHIGFDIEDVPPKALIRLLRDAAARLEELQG